MEVDAPGLDWTVDM